MIATAIPREMLLHVVKTLPAAPRILAELGHMLLDVNADLQAVANLLRCDTSLTTRIIRISNSVFYNPGQPHGSIEEALARIGFGEVYRVAGLAATVQFIDQDFPLYGITGLQMRENSVLTALVMEAAASQTGSDPRLAYTVGLLRSVGKVALSRLTRSAVYAGGHPSVVSGGLAEMETGLIGLTNCEAAAVILTEWRFPRTMIEAIKDHYAPDTRVSTLATVLNLAAGAAERGGHGLTGETAYWLTTPEIFAAAGIEPEQMEDILRQALEIFGQIRPTLG